MGRKKRDAGRFLADVLSGYPGLPVALAYEDWYALWLNLPRQRMQRAHEVYQGICLALSKSPFPASYFDAVALLGEDAAAEAFRVNAQREAAIERAKRGFE